MKLEEILERLHDGRLYQCNDKELTDYQRECQEKLYDYNHTRPAEDTRRQTLLKEMFAEFGDGNFLEPPVHSNWGCRRVHFGSDIYSNFGLTLVDDTDIFVEDNVLFGPHVTLCSGTHPVSPRLREKQVQYNKPIRIRRNAWLGGNVFVMPGVTIGENSIIGAGSVVTKDIPDNVIAVGNPCRVLRKITEDDDKYYDHGKEIDLEP